MALLATCAVLLAVQFLGVLLYPFLEGSLQGRQLFALFGLFVLGLVVFAVRATPGLTWIAGILAQQIGAPYTAMITGAWCIWGGLWFTRQLPRVNAEMRPIYQEKALLAARGSSLIPEVPETAA